MKGKIIQMSVKKYENKFNTTGSFSMPFWGMSILRCRYNLHILHESTKKTFYCLNVYRHFGLHPWTFISLIHIL